MRNYITALMVLIMFAFAIVGADATETCGIWPWHPVYGPLTNWEPGFVDTDWKPGTVEMDEETGIIWGVLEIGGDKDVCDREAGAMAGIIACKEIGTRHGYPDYFAYGRILINQEGRTPEPSWRGRSAFGQSELAYCLGNEIRLSCCAYDHPGGRNYFGCGFGDSLGAVCYYDVVTPDPPTNLRLGEHAGETWLFWRTPEPHSVDINGQDFSMEQIVDFYRITITNDGEETTIEFKGIGTQLEQELGSVWRIEVASVAGLQTSEPAYIESQTNPPREIEPEVIEPKTPKPITPDPVIPEPVEPEEMKIPEMPTEPEMPVEEPKPMDEPVMTPEEAEGGCSIVKTETSLPLEFLLLLGIPIFGKVRKWH